MKKTIVKIFTITLFFIITTSVFSEEKFTAIEYCNMGKDAEMAGDFYKAIEMYKSSLMLNTNYLNAITGLAHAYFGLDEYNESIKYVNYAETFDVNNTDMLILKAKIYLATGRLEESKQIFKEVLNLEENNVDAVFGLAELDIASGRTTSAENRYKNVLMYSPESRKALLSLVLLNDSKENFKEADVYIQQALKIYSENPFVRYVAAKHYYYFGNIDESIFHVKTAIFLKPDYLDAGVFLAGIFIDQEKYQEAALELEKLLKNNESEYLLWYMLGRCYEKMQQPEEALQFYARSIVNKPDEEFARIAIENLLYREFRMDSEMRKSYSEYHLVLGEKYEEASLPQKALKEYRRAIKINPYSREARYKYALIHKVMGYKERYLQILEQIKADGDNSIEINDEIEIEKSLMEKTISEKWESEQFFVDKDANKLSIYISKNKMRHIEGEQILNEYLTYLMQEFENIEIVNNSIKEKFADCYRDARENNSDYFVIIDCKENERIISLTADIYNASTGSLLKSISSIKTGNQMFVNACRDLTEQIEALLPVYGRILNREFDKVLVNIGKKSGIEVGSELYILKKGSLKLSGDDFSLQYDEQDILGTYKVENVNELLSEGLITSMSFFDMINQGDVVFLKPEKNQKDEVETENNVEKLYSNDDLFKSIINIR